MGDPARSGDAFAWVGAAFDLHKYEIQFRLAKQFFHTPYANVASWAMNTHKRINPNFMGIEQNNEGKKVLRLFHNKYQMDYMQGITTSAGLTEKTRQMGFAMDRGMIKFPSKPSTDMQECFNNAAID